MARALRVNGWNIKIGNMVTSALFVAVAGGMLTGAMAWGEMREKTRTLTSIQKLHEQKIEEIRKKLGTLSEGQAATKSTVDAIKTQQTQDRAHYDKQFDRLLDEVRRR